MEMCKYSVGTLNIYGSLLFETADPMRRAQYRDSDDVNSYLRIDALYKNTMDRCEQEINVYLNNEID